VISVFLFHELPLPVRYKVLQESHRVLNPDGHVVMIDSLQYGDSKAMDPSLKHFPEIFHEPFYMNYIKTPMESVMSEAGFKVLEKKNAVASKVVIAGLPT
jgi:ubiquinone/menaquinone biosynthesis C-methylase UbiE